MPRVAKNKSRTIKQELKVSRTKKAKSFSRLRGMKDVLPDDFKYWDLVKRKASELAKFYGFKQIDTPVLEDLELYERSTGKTSDIVTKEMYSFIDKGGNKVALRPEATPSIVRAYIEHGMANQPQPVNFYWIGQTFRHDKPQSGRLRQFTQISIESIGDASPVTDAQMVAIAYNFFRELQIEVVIQVNSIGCPECRKEYHEKLAEYYKERGRRSKLCNDCKKRLIKNPLRLLDCKEKGCIELASGAPQSVDSLCDECRDHFIKVLEYLDELEIPYNLNPKLVRGLDYYTRTVFEVWPAEVEDEIKDANRQSALAAGGRYDGLVEFMGGQPTPGCGFAIGVERVIIKIKENNIPIKDNQRPDLFLAQLGEVAKRKAMVFFEELRRSGYNARQAFTKDNLKAQLEIANRLGVRYCLILGQKEIMDGTIIIRDMESGNQEIVDYKKVINEIDKRLSVQSGDSAVIK
jgi:histidyl-tRNA synthetase